MSCLFGPGLEAYRVGMFFFVRAQFQIEILLVYSAHLTLFVYSSVWRNSNLQGSFLFYLHMSLSHLPLYVYSQTDNIQVEYYKKNTYLSYVLYTTHLLSTWIAFSIYHSVLFPRADLSLDRKRRPFRLCVSKWKLRFSLSLPSTLVLS